MLENPFKKSYIYAIYEMALMANGVKSKEHHQIWDTLDWKKNWHVGILCRDHPKNLNICVIICIICALLWICNDMCIFSIFVPTCEGNSLTYGARWRT
jgi:hypothetical protein